LTNKQELASTETKKSKIDTAEQAWKKFEELAKAQGFNYRIESDFAFVNTSTGKRAILKGINWDTEEIGVEIC